MTEDNPPGLLGRAVGAVTGRVVDAVPPEVILDHIDIDALLDHVDLNHLLDRVDANRLLDRIDPNALLDRVDINRLLARADVQALLADVDLEDLVRRAGIPDIVADTTGNLAGRSLDIARRQIVGLDALIVGLVNRVLRREPLAQPGPPALLNRDDAAVGRTARRRSVSGRYGGPVSRALAAAIDVGFVLASYSLGVGLLGFLVRTLLDTEISWGAGWPATTLLVCWGGFYLMLTTAISGRTVGKGLVGLKVVRRDGGFLHGRQAIVRVLLLPVSVWSLGLGLIPIVVRRDHRALHDLLAGTAVVYDWGDRAAELPAPLSAYLSERDD